MSYDKLGVYTMGTRKGARTIYLKDIANNIKINVREERIDKFLK
jgi:hypothetical protein